MHLALLSVAAFLACGCAGSPYLPPPGHQLTIEASPPVFEGNYEDRVFGGQRGAFKMIFRVRGTRPAGTPVAIALDSRTVQGWEASVTPSASSCVVLGREGLMGIHYHLFPQAGTLMQQQAAKKPVDILSQSESRLVRATFHCDHALKRGDRAYIRIRFYVMSGFGFWGIDDFVFENELIQ
jgi:hypothetical protein